jgi:pimeloyl-ACP methyl ester carboxylesterase
MTKNPESPTLVLFGADDATIDQSLWQNVKQSIRVPFTLKSITHCGHWIQQEAPQTVNRELLAFLMGRTEE